MKNGWPRRFFYGCLVLALGLLLWPVLDPSGLSQWVRLTSTEQELQHNIRAKREEILNISNYNHRLIHDMSLIERLARDKMIFARPNEYVILLHPDILDRGSGAAQSKPREVPDDYTATRPTEFTPAPPRNPKPRSTPHQ